MKTFFVVNPRSANGQTGRRWAEIAAEIGKVVPTYAHAFTERALHAEQLSRRALQDGYECIVAVGGDGTVNEVTNGFFEGGRAINPNAALGVIPRGTGGDFRRTFNWDLELASALERLRGERTLPFDVGLCEYLRADGAPETRYFANIASFGVSGMVVKKVNESSKALGGRVSFMWGSIKALVAYRDVKVRISLDGGPMEEVPVTCLAVANGRYFGGGMMVAPEAETADGVFDVTLWSGYGLTDFVFRQKGIYSGEHAKWDRTRRFRARSVRAEAGPEVLLDVDGEQPGRLPCSMRIVPQAIRIKVGEARSPAFVPEVAQVAATSHGSSLRRG